MRTETKIISFANHKGGVGKTTTTATVGSLLAKAGCKVLVIDLDAQANLTSSLMKPAIPQMTIYDAIVRGEELPITAIDRNLFLVPSSELLAMADVELSSAISRENILSRLIKRAEQKMEKKFDIHFDYVLIDCPPSLGILTLNALTASTDVIVPLVAEVLPFNGLKMINNFVNTVQQRLNEKVHITGILLTRWENTKLSNSIEKALRENLGEKVFNTKIRKNVSVAEAPLESQNLIDYAPKSRGAADYKDFVEELFMKFNNKHQKE